MLTVQKQMHTNFVHLYKRVYDGIVGFLENRVWHFEEMDCVMSASDILRALADDIQKSGPKNFCCH